MDTEFYSRVIQCLQCCLQHGLRPDPETDYGTLPDKNILGYGIINICAKDLILEKYGDEAWETIRQKAEVDDKFVNYDLYPDALTYKIVKAAAELLGSTSDEVWELFGVYWVLWCMRRGYDALFRTLGRTLFDFLANLDFLHSVYMKTMYPNMTVPSFRVEERGDEIMILHYYSNRPQLGGIVLGIVKGVARIIFNTEIRMHIKDHNELTLLGVKKDHYRFLIMFINYDLPPLGSSGYISDEEWNVVINGTVSSRTRHTSIHSLSGDLLPHGCPSSAPNGAAPSPQKQLARGRECLRVPADGKGHFTTLSVPCLRDLVVQSNGQELQRPTSRAGKRGHFRPVVPDKILLDGLTFCQAFPYHVVFDRQMQILHAGIKLQTFCPRVNEEGAKLNDIMELHHPEIEMTSENICLFINMIFLLSLRQGMLGRKNGSSKHLTLRGQMIRMEANGLFAFLCSPVLTSLAELQSRHMHFSDIAPHDVTRDLILFNQQRIAEVELAKELEQKKEELRSLMRDLAREKEKTDSLLSSMLPKEVANDLREGRHVQAGEFPEVTVMFSDIVKFTDMCSQCQPIQVVHFLNEIYSQFDKLTTVYNIYKVETIGDAYMVVGGLPVFSKTHTERVISFGLDALDLAPTLTSPVKDHCIQIRVGAHTGPVVAGVVGVKMPRYCLFGDTVNTASRMESHGAAGKIHASEAVVNLLKGVETKFHAEVRGSVHIKGKGDMMTYFITRPSVEGATNVADKAEDSGDVEPLSHGIAIDVEPSSNGISIPGS
ncbi:guanylate cyclase soluble subunit beta-2-like [Diadema antillarum]|uniref:guanylate cyclase soluble subunit beta-2-like n=1 Tax=Diadema antillarum TaxID=105358 RepID=UPI003A838518